MTPSSAITHFNPNERRSSFILIVLYVVGVFGAIIPLHSDFLLLTPANLIISLILVLWCHQNWNTGIILSLLFAWVAGYSIECLGVNTGQIFGVYSYGPVLGYKVMDTPLMIGVNWVMLIYCTSVSTNYFLPNSSWLVKSIVASLLMVSLDVLIEPVAIYYNFWHWEAVEVPWKNYFAWFGISFCLNSLYIIMDEGKSRNNVALVLLIIQFAFFWILGLFL